MDIFPLWARRNLLILILIFSIDADAKNDEIVYVRMPHGCTLSSILFSVGAIPLYGRSGLVKVHENYFSDIYSQYLRVGQDIPILKSSIEFEENLEEIGLNLYRIKEVLNTLDEFSDYIKRRKIQHAVDIIDFVNSTSTSYDKKLVSELGSMDTDKVRLNKHGLLFGVGIQPSRREYTLGDLQTNSISLGQPLFHLAYFRDLDKFTFELEYLLQPWFEKKVSISPDYSFRAILLTNFLRLNSSLAVSRNKRNYFRNIENSLVGDSSSYTSLELGVRFSLLEKLGLVATYDIFLQNSMSSSIDINKLYGVKLKMNLELVDDFYVITSFEEVNLIGSEESLNITIYSLSLMTLL